MALIESPEGIQVALMETINAIVRNTVDLKRANLLLRALSIAARNARHVRFDRCESEMVRKLPEPLPLESQPPAAAPEASLQPQPQPHSQTASTQAWDEQWNQQKKKPEPARKPAGRVPADALEAQAVNAYPMRE
jgi:hypothetical protein